MQRIADHALSFDGPVSNSANPRAEGRPALASRLIPLALVVLFCTAWLLTVARVSADSATPGSASVNSSDGLHLRAGPGTSYPELAVMPSGAAVVVTGVPTADGWYPVTYNGQPGWADGAYLTLAQAASNPSPNAIASSVAAAPPPVPAPPIAPPAPVAAATPAAGPPPSATAALPAGSVVALPLSGLNLRTAPDPSSSVVTVIPGGAPLTETGAAAGNWLPVSYQGSTGWVDGSFVSGTAAAGAGNPAIFSTSTSSTGAATVAPPAGAGSSSGSSAYGSAATGVRAPAESGLTAIAAPPGTLGRFAWPVDSRIITTIFQPLHQAIDIDQSPKGNLPVRAMADGLVSFAGGDPCCSYGLYVIIQHADGYSSLYAHFSSLEVKQGQSVKQGQELGLSGATGHATGPHVHFAIYYRGMPLDPLGVLPPGGVQIWPGSNVVS